MKSNHLPTQFIHAELLQQTGSDHLLHHSACEDILYEKVFPSFCFYGLADGQSGKPRCKEGGLAALQTLAACMDRHGIQNLIHSRFPDELPYLLMKEVRQTLLSLSETIGGTLSDYASTLLAIAIDTESKDYLLVHLGDGCALSIQSDGSILSLSPPENTAMGHTWLTSSDHAVSHFRCILGSIQTQKRIVLLSDGADICRGKNIPPQNRKLLCDGSAQDIRTHWEAKCPVDDASCILLDFPNST